jgi:hypothetical protein
MEAEDWLKGVEKKLVIASARIVRKFFLPTSLGIRRCVVCPTFSTRHLLVIPLGSGTAPIIIKSLPT